MITPVTLHLLSSHVAAGADEEARGGPMHRSHLFPVECLRTEPLLLRGMYELITSELTSPSRNTGQIYRHVHAEKKCSRRAASSPRNTLDHVHCPSLPSNCPKHLSRARFSDLCLLCSAGRGVYQTPNVDRTAGFHPTRYRGPGGLWLHVFLYQVWRPLWIILCMMRSLLTDGRSRQSACVSTFQNV